MDALVQISNVTKCYDSGHPAVDAVSLMVAPGEAVAVMGPSGSGKSTLLNLIAGLDRPSSGTVTVAGQRIDVLGETGMAKFRQRQIGMIFQFFNLLEDLTVADNVLLPAQLSGLRGGQARARADELLAALRIERYQDAYPGRLSGGERQRVAIARALAGEPAIVLADEPTGNLDSATGASLLALLGELNSGGTTIVVVTHDHAIAARMHRQIEMLDGRIITDTAAAAPGQRPRHAAGEDSPPPGPGGPPPGEPAGNEAAGQQTEPGQGAAWMPWARHQEQEGSS